MCGRSLTGAWIETRGRSTASSRRSVAPSRERGSKPVPGRDEGHRRLSLPHGSVDRNFGQLVAVQPGAGRSLTGAWIETSLRAANSDRSTSLPHGSVDRNVRSIALAHRRAGRSLAGAWIETMKHLALLASCQSRSLTGAWIETSRPGAPCETSPSRSLTGAWIENVLAITCLAAELTQMLAVTLRWAFRVIPWRGSGEQIPPVDDRACGGRAAGYRLQRPAKRPVLPKATSQPHRYSGEAVLHCARQ